MRTKVVYGETRVILDLSVDEFSVLEHLCYRYLVGGQNGLRSEIEDGFREAYASLSKVERDLVAEARKVGDLRGYNSDEIEKIFSKHRESQAKTYEIGGPYP